MAKSAAAQQQAQLAALKSHGEERTLRQADDAAQKRLALAIAKTQDDDAKRQAAEAEL